MDKEFMTLVAKELSTAFKRVADKYQGKQTSEAKLNAAKNNGKKGGRPPKNDLEALPKTNNGRKVALKTDRFIDVVLYGAVKEEVIQAWRDAYKDEAWIAGELNQATIWAKSNSHKAPKKAFDRFYSSWLSRSWEKHRKTLTSVPVASSKDIEHRAGVMANQAIQADSSLTSADWNRLKSEYLKDLKND